MSADSLRGHLSFLASDALGGRVNGTPGIEIAAEYVAAQFRRAGLEPIGDDGYFQTVAGVVATPTREGFRFSIALDQTVDVSPETFDMTTVEPVTVDGLAVVKVPPGRADALDAVAGKVVITDRPEAPPRNGTPGAARDGRRWIQDVLDRDPALLVVLVPGLAAPWSSRDLLSLHAPGS